jgi:hypothetical protein
MVDLCAPLKIFIYQEDDATNYRKEQQANRLLSGISLHGSDRGRNCKTGYQQDDGIDRPDHPVKFFTSLGKELGIPVQVCSIKHKKSAKKDNFRIEKQPHS